MNLPRTWKSLVNFVGALAALFTVAAISISAERNARINPSITSQKAERAGDAAVRKSGFVEAKAEAITAEVPVFKTQKVLSLRYQGMSNKGGGAEKIGEIVNTTANYVVGGKEEGALLRGKVLAVDSKKHVYIYDPVNLKEHLLKKINSKGELVNSWVMPFSTDAYGSGCWPIDAAITESEHLWIKIHCDDERNGNEGIPLLIYNTNEKNSVSDWRTAMPSGIKKKLKKKSPDGIWDLYSFSAAGNRMLVYLDERDPQSYVSLQDLLTQISDDGSEIINLEPRKEGENIWNILSPDQQRWNVDYELSNGNQNLWLWKAGTKRGSPLLTRQEIMKLSSWWQKNFSFEPSQRLPNISVDGRDNIYMEWNRTLRREVNNEKAHYEQMAVVVMNAQRQIIAYLPWKNKSFLGDQKIFILPDGSGFYRVEYASDELLVYFHPIPT